MTRPPDEQPTTVLPQQTVEQPSVTTSPATRRTRTWHHRIPARIGRARSSTVVIGALFVLLGGLNLVLPEEDTGTTPVTTSDGRTILVPNSAIPSDARTPTTPADTPAPSPSDEAPAPTSTAPTGTRAPSSAPADEDEDEDTGTTPAPSSTSRSTTSTAPAPSSSARTTPTSRAPATTEAVPSEEQAPEETADPTG